MIKGIFLIVSMLATISLIGCGEDSYNAFIYPDRADLFEYKNIGQYPTFEACKAASIKELKDIGAEEDGYWQCGKNCTDSRGVISVQACESVDH